MRATLEDAPNGAYSGWLDTRLKPRETEIGRFASTVDGIRDEMDAAYHTCRNLPEAQRKGAVSLNEVYGTLQGAIFSELKTGAEIDRMRRSLQRDTLYGQEAKPLPYMLAQMNLLLHGVDAPNIAYRDSLSQDHAVDAEAYSLVLANPPFAGSLEV